MNQLIFAYLNKLTVLTVKRNIAGACEIYLLCNVPITCTRLKKLSYIVLHLKDTHKYVKYDFEQFSIEQKKTLLEMQKLVRKTLEEDAIKVYTFVLHIVNSFLKNSKG